MENLQSLVTPAQINDAYATLVNARTEYRYAEQQAIDLKAALEIVKAEKIYSGEIVGKNADERESNARKMFPQMYDQAERAEHDSKRAKSDLDIAYMEVERIKLLVRLMELEINLSHD